MAWQIVPIDPCEQTYSNRAKQFSDQVSQNVYVEVNPLGKVLHSFYGLASWITGISPDRGAYIFGDELLKVSGSTLYSYDSEMNETSKGTIAGTGRVMFADDGTTCVITTASVAYINDQMIYSGVGTYYSYSSGTLGTMSDPDLASLTGQLFVTTTPGDPTDVPALNFAASDAKPGTLLRPYTFRQLAYMINTEHMEIWQNTGSGTPPFERFQDVINIGCAATHSVANNPNFMYLLGDDLSVYRIDYANSSPITPPGITNIIEGLSFTSDAIGMCFNFESQNFYMLTFPTAGKTLLYNEHSDRWTTLSYSGDGGAYLGSSYAKAFGLHLFSDRRNGNIYYLDKDTYSDNGVDQIRWRTMAPITGADIGAPGDLVTVSELTLDMEVGVGLESGQGSTPVFMFQVSNDGGRTWSYESLVEIGVVGDYDKQVRYQQFITGPSIVYRFKCSDPVQFSIFRGAVKIRRAGRG